MKQFERVTNRYYLFVITISTRRFSLAIGSLSLAGLAEPRPCVVKRLALIPEATNWFLTAFARAKESNLFLAASPLLSV